MLAGKLTDDERVAVHRAFMCATRSEGHDMKTVLIYNLWVMKLFFIGGRERTTSPPLGPQKNPGHGATVGSYGGDVLMSEVPL